MSLKMKRVVSLVLNKNKKKNTDIFLKIIVQMCWSHELSNGYGKIVVDM